MTVDNFMERIIDQFSSDKERVYPESLRRDLMVYLGRFSQENLNYLWSGLVKTYSRSYKRLPGIAEVEKAWKTAKELRDKDRHPDIDMLREYRPDRMIEEDLADPETVKGFFEKLHNIARGKKV